MDTWGGVLGSTKNLSLAEKGEIVCAFLEGFKRQDQALGYTRAYRGLLNALPNGLETLEQDIPFDVVQELKTSRFGELAKIPEDEMVNHYKKKLEEFVCPVTKLKF